MSAVGTGRGGRRKAAGGAGARRDVAVVTGASSGIGRAIALALAPRCALVALIGRAEARLRAAAAAVGRQGADASTWVADLADDGAVADLVRRLHAALPRVDVLVHGAGAYAMGSFAEAPVEAFDQQFRVNVRAPYALTQALLPSLKRSRGQVVFVNSSAGLAARAGVAQYAASKHALKALADSLRDEVNPARIRVLTVYPGRTATPMQERVHAFEGRAYRPQRLLRPSDVATAVVSALSLPRTAEVTDVSIRPFAKPQ